MIRICRFGFIEQVLDPSCKINHKIIQEVKRHFSKAIFSKVHRTGSVIQKSTKYNYIIIKQDPSGHMTFIQRHINIDTTS